MITETDHMIMRPPKNVATEEKPVGFGFYYMISTDPKLLPVVKKFLKPEIDVHTVDAVGPSPLIIHKPMLEKVAEPWWKLSLEMKHDSAANTVFGWVLEMWGYNLAARNLGIRHTVLQDLQVTAATSTTTALPLTWPHLLHLPPIRRSSRRGSAPTRWTRKTSTTTRLGSCYKAAAARGDWTRECTMAATRRIICRCRRRARRRVGSSWRGCGTRPPRGSRGGPTASPSRGRTATPTRRSRGCSRSRPTTAPRCRRSRRLLRGTGPWEWGGAGKLYLFARGIAALEAPGTTSNKPPKIGAWRATAAHLVRLSLCGVEFERDETPEAPWHFSAAADSDGWKGAVADGALVSKVQRSEHVLPQETRARRRAVWARRGGGR